MDTYGRRGGGRRGGGGRGGGARRMTTSLSTSMSPSLMQSGLSAASPRGRGRGPGLPFRPPVRPGMASSGYEHLSQNYSDGGYYDQGYFDPGYALVAEGGDAPIDIEGIADAVASDLAFGALSEEEDEALFGAGSVGIQRPAPRSVVDLADEVVTAAVGQNLRSASVELQRASRRFNDALNASLRSGSSYSLSPFLLKAVQISSVVLYGDAPGSSPRFGAAAVYAGLSGSDKAHVSRCNARVADALRGRVDEDTAREVYAALSEQCSVTGASCPPIASDAYGNGGVQSWAQEERRPAHFKNSLMVGAGLAAGVVGVFTLTSLLSRGMR